MRGMLQPLAAMAKTFDNVSLCYSCNRTGQIDHDREIHAYLCEKDHGQFAVRVRVQQNVPPVSPRCIFPACATGAVGNR